MLIDNTLTGKVGHVTALLQRAGQHIVFFFKDSAELRSWTDKNKSRLMAVRVPQVVGTASVGITALSSHKSSSAHYHLLLQNPVTPPPPPPHPSSCFFQKQSRAECHWNQPVQRQAEHDVWDLSAGARLSSAGDQAFRWGPRVRRPQLASLPADKHFFSPPQSLDRGNVTGTSLAC